MKPISRGDVTTWFEQEGWNPIHHDSFEMEFRSGQAMPEGITRVAVVQSFSSHHELQMWLEAFDGLRVPLDENKMRVETAHDLAVSVATLGPKSFTHVIIPFARVVRLPEKLLEHWVGKMGFTLETAA